MISKEEVDNLATLARLELSDAEKAGLQTDISNILEYVGQVSAVQLQGALPNQQTSLTPTLSKASPLTPYNVLREDIARDSADTMAGKKDKVKEAFPKREGEYNVVRKIIQKDE
jgi:aspartyl/glutamyl-tRNA(Asn/Gln) amidotransferase C subunit